jgi:hypothetical protein
MLFGDSRDRWDGDGVTDPRVQHFWDEHKVVGNWFSSNVLHREGTMWDFYAVYGPDATWGPQPPYARGQGGTIITHRTQLQAAITPLLHADALK